MDNPDSAVLSATIAESLRLDVVFRRVRDRIGHSVVLRCLDTDLPLLSSVEGGGDEVWPTSPPLQQISLESHAPGQRTALLVGMAGRSHWSLCIVQDSDPPGFVFDVACRAPECPLWLGTCYQALAPIQPAGANTVVLQALPVAVQVALEAIPQEAPVAITCEDEGLTMRVAGHDRALPATFRWKYRVSAGK